MKQIDILVPCYNEEAVLPQFYQRTCAVIDALPDYAFTFIFVNDGSRDQTSCPCAVAICASRPLTNPLPPKINNFMFLAS